MEESILVSSIGTVSAHTDISCLRMGVVLACWCVLVRYSPVMRTRSNGPGRCLGRDQSLLQTLLLPVMVVPTLLPTPLLEPRYFLVPYVLLRAQVSDVPAWGLALEGIWYVLINAVTMGVFLYYPRGDIRFMW